MIGLQKKVITINRKVDSPHETAASSQEQQQQMPIPHQANSNGNNRAGNRNQDRFAQSATVNNKKKAVDSDGMNRSYDRYVLDIPDNLFPPNRGSDPFLIRTMSKNSDKEALIQDETSKKQKIHRKNLISSSFVN